MHLTLVPYIAAAGELKTKPTQHSVKELRSIGIQPDVLLCRSEQPLPDSERRKIALFTNVPETRGHLGASTWTTSTRSRCRSTRKASTRSWSTACASTPARPTCREWDEVVDASEHPVDEVTIAVVGKYVDHQDAYKSLAEALKHGGLRQRTRVKLKWLESSEIEQRRRATRSKDVDGILVPGGFGDRGFEGKVLTAQVRARDRHSVLRHLLRHAGGGGRRTPATSPAWTAPTAPRTTRPARIR